MEALTTIILRRLEMKAKTPRRILRRNSWKMARGDHFCPSKKREIKEAIRVAVKEVKKDA